jgi:hypothetical protein
MLSILRYVSLLNVQTVDNFPSVRLFRSALFLSHESFKDRDILLLAAGSASLLKTEAIKRPMHKTAGIARFKTLSID